jgi:hypothetical protein
METTFTLVITWSISAAGWFGWFTPAEQREHRTPGLMQIECERMAAGVQKPKRAECVREDVPKVADGTKCYTVCGWDWNASTQSPCWEACGVPIR